VSAIVTRLGPLGMQVCVPKEWTDDEVIAFAEREHPCGTDHGWAIRHDGDPLLRGERERVVCASDPSKVHIMLDA